MTWPKTISKIVLFSPILLLLLLIFASQAQGGNSEEKATVKEFKLELKAGTIPEQDIYWGENSGTIINPRCVDFKLIVQSTEEYQKIIADKLDRSGAKYWILISRASDVAVRKIRDYAEEKKLEFICSKSTLLSLLNKLPEFENTRLSDLEKQFNITKQILTHRPK